MILCQISDAERYKNISPAIAEAIEWLGAHVKDEFVKGSVELGDTGIRVNSEEVALRPRENAVLEAHRRYIDIHVPLKGRESIGWAAVDGLNYPRDKYDEENDIIRRLGHDRAPCKCRSDSHFLSRRRPRAQYRPRQPPQTLHQDSGLTGYNSQSDARGPNTSACLSVLVI